MYLAADAAGLPVFAGAGHGPGVIFGASGGYLVGFLLAAALVGYGARRGADRSVGLTLLLFALGWPVSRCTRTRTGTPPM